MNQLTKPEAWEAWKSHPLTKEFFQFLAERRESLMQAWGSGAPSGEDERVQAFTLHQIGQLRARDIRTFYGIEDDGDADQGGTLA